MEISWPEAEVGVCIKCEKNVVKQWNIQLKIQSEPNNHV